MKKIVKKRVKKFKGPQSDRKICIKDFDIIFQDGGADEKLIAGKYMDPGYLQRNTTYRGHGFECWCLVAVSGRTRYLCSGAMRGTDSFFTYVLFCLFPTKDRNANDLPIINFDNYLAILTIIWVSLKI